MVRVAVAYQQVKKIYLPQVVAAVAPRSPWRHEVLEARSQASDRTPVTGVVVAVDASALRGAKDSFEQMADVFAENPWVRSPERPLQLCPAAFLMNGHSPLSAQLAIAEVDEKVGVLFDCEMVMKRMILAELERLESINDHVVYWSSRFDHLTMIEEAMPAQATEMTVHRFRGHTQISRNLPIGHSANGLHENCCIEVGELLPIRRAESLTTERAPTAEARKPLDTLRVLMSKEESSLLVAPVFG